jgi:hypothetical protein
MVPFNTAEMEPQASFYVTNILGVIPIFENDSNSVTPSEGIRELI